ncbi:DNA polymerase III subunit delta [bacterium]|nr:DNA polymerase III subunit delta [bacterium]
MIILLHGQDSYRLKKKLKDILEQSKKESKGNLYLKRFSSKDFDFEEFKNEYQSTPLFLEKKFLILENLSATDALKEVISFLKKQSDFKNTIVFYEESVLEEGSLLLKFVKKNGISFKFELLEEGELIKWIKEEFKKYKVEIDSSIASTLVEFFGNDLWLLSNEIRKIVLLSLNKGRITPESITHLVRTKLETDIFQTIEAISSQNKDKALRFLYRHIEQGDSPFYLLSMLRLQITNLLIVKELVQKGFPLDVISSKRKLSVFVVRKYIRLSYRFSLESLKKIYWKIFQYEIKIKTGKVDPVLALELLTIEI